MAALRATPPAALLDRPVTRVDDLAAPRPASALPPSDVLVAGLRRRAAGRRAPERHRAEAQGYLEVIVPVAAREDVPVARARAARDLTALRDEVAALLRP